MPENIFIIFFEISLATSAVILIILLFTSIFRKKYDPKFKYWLWILIGLRLLIPVNIQMNIPKVNIEIPKYQYIPDTEQINNNNVSSEAKVSPDNSNQTTSETPTEIISSGNKEINNSAVLSQPEPLNILTILSVIWISGVVVMLSHHFIGYYIYLKQLKRRADPINNSMLSEIINSIKDNFSIKQNVLILTDKKITCPMMTGILKPILLIPEFGYPQNELKYIITHEFIHYKRRDLWYKFFMTTVKSVHWFNPLIWIMYKEFNKDLELSCDNEVVKKLSIENRKIYSESILAAIPLKQNEPTVFVTNFYGGKKIMKDRLSNIMNTKKRHNGIITLLILLIAVILAGTMFSCTSVEGIYNSINTEPNISSSPSPVTNTPTLTPSTTPSLSTENTSPIVTPTSPSESDDFTHFDISSIEQNSLSNYKNVKQIKCSDQINIEFALTTSYVLKNFKVVTVAYDGVDDGVNWHIDKVHYEQQELDRNTALEISAYINDISSNLLIIYDTPGGKTAKYFIMYDMRGEGGYTSTALPLVIKSAI